MFDKKKYEIEYEKHHKLMKQMQKLGAPKKLPPIELKKREMGVIKLILNFQLTLLGSLT